MKYEKEFDNTLKILEGDGGKFISLEEVSNLDGTADWSYICIRMLKKYFNKS